VAHHYYTWQHSVELPLLLSTGHIMAYVDVRTQPSVLDQCSTEIIFPRRFSNLLVILQYSPDNGHSVTETFGDLTIDV
jgi:hypothetical protein